MEDDSGRLADPIIARAGEFDRCRRLKNCRRLIRTRIAKTERLVVEYRRGSCAQLLAIFGGKL